MAEPIPAFDENEFATFDENEFAPKPAAASQKAASPGFLDTVSSYIPQGVKDFWNYTSEPLTDLPTRVGKAASDYLEPTQYGTYDPRRYLFEYPEALGRTVSGMSSLQNLALTAATGGAGAAEAAGMRGTAQGLRLVGAGLSAPVAAHGASEVYSNPTVSGKLMGAAELAMGGLGAAEPFRAPKIRSITPEVKAPEVDMAAAHFADVTKQADEAIKATPTKDAITQQQPETKPTFKPLTNVPEGADFLTNMVNDESAHPEVRAKASELLGRIQSGELSPQQAEQFLFEDIDARQARSELKPVRTEPQATFDPSTLQFEDQVSQLEKQIPPEMKQSIQVEGAPQNTPNASGESSASAEALSRQEGMRSRGEQYVVYDKAGNEKPLIGPDAVDYVAKEGETYGIKTPRGFVQLENNGGKIPEGIKTIKNRKEYPGYKGTEPPAEIPPTEAGGGNVPPEPPRKQAAEFGPNEPNKSNQSTTLLTKDQLKPDIPIKERPESPLPTKPTKLSEVWNAARSLQSVDLPGVTSAALRQSRPLAFTTDWFRAWTKAYKAFGSEVASKAINAKVQEHPLLQPRYEPVYSAKGDLVRYSERPSIAEELGLKLTDVLNNREEAIQSSLAERIPGYGRYVKASNRAYTAFLNDLRVNKLQDMINGAKAQGKNPELDLVLGKQMADFVNNATGRGSLKFGRANLEPIASELGAVLYSPRALSARLSFLNPYNYIKTDPLVRQEYFKGLARIAASWGAFSGLASMAGAAVSTDPTSADFGKIRIGNTRIDPGAGWQQLLVLTSKEIAGKSTSTTGEPGEPGKINEFGTTPMSPTHLSTAGKYTYNQLNPSLRFAFDLAGASRKEPFDITDRTLQLVLPMYITDILDAAKEDSTVAMVFAPLLSSIGAGVQTYEKGDFGKPQITPFINQVLGTELPTHEFGR